MALSTADIFNLGFYFLGSCFGVFLAVFFTWYGDLESLSVDWVLLRYLSDEWRLLFSLLLFSFSVYCVLNFQHEIKKMSKPTLAWWQRGIVYQIYPRSFKDTTGNGIGDLKGVIEKLDYLKTIGADILWLNPIYPSGGKDNGYDITSYYDIDKLYGGMKDFDSLVQKVHQKGLHLVMDFIPNHTSNKHEWFVKSCSNDSKYRDYYVWYPSNEKSNPPNNWVNVMGNQAWTYNEKRKAWYYHTFLSDQPDLNMRCPAVREEMRKVIKFWLEDKRVDGLRIDAMKHLFEDESFRSEPRREGSTNNDGYGKLDHIYTTNLPETTEILAEWRELVDEIGKRTKSVKLLYVESTGSPLEQIKYFNHNGKPASHFPLNFQLLNFCENKKCLINALNTLTEFKPQLLKKTVDDWLAHRNTKYFWSNWQIGNHDKTRVATRLHQDNVKLANALNLLLGGTPFTYYGEEIGMEDLDLDSIKFEDCQDDFGKSVGAANFKKYSRDYCRSPMQWNNSANAGFTAPGVKTWLPINANYSKLNVEEQTKRVSSTLQVYIDIAKLRQNDSFLWGSFRFAIVDEHIFSFIRSAFDHLTFLVAMNISDEDIAVNFFTTKFAPFTVTIAYYFDNTTNTPLDSNLKPPSPSPYTIKQQINTKNIVLKAKSCIILSWKST